MDGLSAIQEQYGIEAWAWPDLEQQRRQGRGGAIEEVLVILCPCT